MRHLPSKQQSRSGRPLCDKLSYSVQCSAVAVQLLFTLSRAALIHCQQPEAIPQRAPRPRTVLSFCPGRLRVKTTCHSEAAAGCSN